MTKKLLMLGIALLAFGCLAWAAEKTYSGVVSDSNCGMKHAKGGDEAAACIAKCVSGGAKYTLISGKKSYNLEPQDKFSNFAGKHVRLKGTLSGDMITASDVSAATAAKKKTAKKSAGM